MTALLAQATHPAAVVAPGPILRRRDGGLLGLDVDRWRDHPSAAELALLGEVEGPVLDVGCGPARHVRALAERGVLALGIDVSSVAVAEARRRGAVVLERSVFGRIPGGGRWRTLLLLDGNIGIGGDPVRLLERGRSLLEPGGAIVVELDDPDVGLERLTVRVERDEHRGPWFPWARLGADAIDAACADAGLTVTRRSWADDRWFAWLTQA